MIRCKYHARIVAHLEICLAHQSLMIHSLAMNRSEGTEIPMVLVMMTYTLLAIFEPQDATMEESLECLLDLTIPFLDLDREGVSRLAIYLVDLSRYQEVLFHLEQDLIPLDPLEVTLIVDLLKALLDAAEVDQAAILGVSQTMMSSHRQDITICLCDNL